MATNNSLNLATTPLPVASGGTGAATSQRIATAYCSYEGVSQTIYLSYNVSSVTYTSPGVYTVNMTTALGGEGDLIPTGCSFLYDFASVIIMEAATSTNVGATTCSIFVHDSIAGGADSLCSIVVFGGGA